MLQDLVLLANPVGSLIVRAATGNGCLKNLAGNHAEHE